MTEFFQKESIQLIDQPEFLHYNISKQNTIIVIDWDDSILPTSYLARNKLSLDSILIPSKISEELEALDQTVCTLLRMAKVLYGEVLIITNAQQGWVELSSKHFLPETHQLLFKTVEETSSVSTSSTKEPEAIPSGKRKREESSEDQIKVFSARFLFERENPSDPSSWKKKAFAKLLKSRISPQFLSKRNIYGSLSDGEVENLDLLNFESNSPKKLRLERRNSSISLSSLELEESIEIETDFCETDSFFSVDFSTPLAMNSLDVNEFSFDAFNHDLETDRRKSRECLNLISIGDCFHDCESLRKLDVDLTSCMKKTIKLIEFPTCEQLQAELENLQIYLDKVIKLKNDVDLVVSRGQV